MKTTRIYLTCTPDMEKHMQRAKKIANQKGCDPTEILWPKAMPARDTDDWANYESDIRTCQRQFRETIADCDLFYAFVGNQYGELEVPFDDASGTRKVSPNHYEVLAALEQSTGLRKRIFTRLNDPVPRAFQLASEISDMHRLDFETDREFEEVFSRELTEYRQETLSAYLESLERFNITIKCEHDQPGLLAGLAEVVKTLHGNVAGGSQITKGSVLLHFVAEWPAEDCPGQEAISQSVHAAFRQLIEPDTEDGATRDRFEVRVTPLNQAPGQAQDFRRLLTFVITFVDQPGIADHIFTITKDYASVLLTEVDTFLSGGIMLGRIRFRVRGDKVKSIEQTRLEEQLRKLPGIMHVDSTALRGRFWE